MPELGSSSAGATDVKELKTDASGTPQQFATEVVTASFKTSPQRQLYQKTRDRTEYGERENSIFVSTKIFSGTYSPDTQQVSVVARAENVDNNSVNCTLIAQIAGSPVSPSSEDFIFNFGPGDIETTTVRAYTTWTGSDIRGKAYWSASGDFTRRDVSLSVNLIYNTSTSVPASAQTTLSPSFQNTWLGWVTPLGNSTPANGNWNNGSQLINGQNRTEYLTSDIQQANIQTTGVSASNVTNTVTFTGQFKATRAKTI